MYIDAGHYQKEGILGHVAYTHLIQMIVVENPVIDPFGAGSVFIDAFELVAAMRYRSKETQIILCGNVYDTAVRAF